MAFGLITAGLGLVAGEISSRQARSQAASQAKAANVMRKNRARAAKGLPATGTKKGSEGRSGSPIVPSARGGVIPGISNLTDMGGSAAFAGPPGGNGKCPGIGSVRINGRCVNLADALPGGDPLITGQVDDSVSLDAPEGSGRLVNGRFGVGVIPSVDVRTVRVCPPGMALGKDGVCYDGLSRNSPKREHPMGMKPLLTAGDRAAIRKAERAAKALERSKKKLKSTAKAFSKIC